MHYVIAALTGLSVAFIGVSYTNSTAGVILTGGSVFAVCYLLTSPAAAAFYRGDKV